MLTFSRNKQWGFSLIEMMVAVALFGILAALAVSSFRTWIANTRIRTAAESIQNGLQVARAEAVKRNTPIQFVFDGNNSAWTVSCVTAVLCDDLTEGIVAARVASEGSSADITVTTDPADSDAVVFNNLGTINALPVPFTQVDISSGDSAADRPLRITLGVGGNAKMCDPYTGLSSSDPRKC